MANSQMGAAAFHVERWDDDDDFDLSSVSGPGIAQPRRDEDRAGISARRTSLSDDDDERGDTLKVSDLTKETLAQLASYAKKPASRPVQAVIQIGAADQQDDEAWDVDVEIPERLSMNSTVKLLAAPGSSTNEDVSDFFSAESISDTTSSSIAADVGKRFRHRLSPHEASHSRDSSQQDDRGSHTHSRTASDTAETYDDLDFGDAVQASGNVAHELQARLRVRRGEERGSPRHAGKLTSTSPDVDEDLSKGLVITDDLDISPSRLRAKSLSKKLREAARSRKQKQGGGKQKQDQAQSESPRPVQTRDTLRQHHSSPAHGHARVSSPAVQDRGARPAGDSQQSNRQRPAEASYAKPTNASQARRSPIPPTGPSQSGKSLKWKRGKGAKEVYGDGHELDRISDLPVQKSELREAAAAGGSSSIADPPPPSTSSSKRRNRQRKKKEPYLIRNLGSAGAGSMQVGDMRWNPTLKRWEGNEKEGREFENAVRGSGRPALITRLSLGSSGIAIGGLITGGSIGKATANVASTSSSLPPSIASRTNLGVAHVVGDMVFDPVNLCWKRQDGEEDLDPFAEMEEEEEEEGGAEQQLRSGMNDEGATRKVRQRTVSAETASDAMDGESKRSDAAQRGTSKGTRQQIRNAIQRQRTGSSVPHQLQSSIPHALWISSLAAERRHEREMGQFNLNPRSGPRHSASSRGGSRYDKAAMAAAADDHLYTIRALARQSHDGL